MIKIPKTDTWTQSGISDTLADLWASFNIDVAENEGKLRLGKRIILNTGIDDVPQITAQPIAFINNSASVFTFAGLNNVGYAFKNDATMIGTFSQDTSTGYPATIDSLRSDAVFSNLAIYVTALHSDLSNFVSLYKKTFGGNWSEIVTTEPNSVNSYTNMLCTSNISGTTKTYMSSQYSKIISLDSSDAITYSGSNTLLIGSANNPASAITKLLSADDRIFILTLNIYGGQGSVYEWDGVSTNFQIQHRLETSGALAGLMFEGNPYIMDIEGKLLAWNGGTFKEVARLNRKNNIPLVYSNAYTALNSRFIHPNGMTSKNGRIQLLINNQNADNTGSIEETIPSGIWEFDPKFPQKGLVHKHSLSFNKSTDIVTNYGQVRLGTVGALQNMNIPSTASGANGTVFIGSGYYSDAITQKYGIFYDDRNDTLQKSGYFITTKIMADDGTVYHLPAVKNSWNQAYVNYRKLLDANDLIAVKYRTSEIDPVEVTITWTSTSTFTTTTDVTSYVGYECEITQGLGGGKASQIVSVTYSAGLYTVTLTDTFYGATGTSKARFQYWKQVSLITGQLEAYDQSGQGDVSNWIQFKVYMNFKGKDEIERLMIINNNYQPAK